MSRVDKSGFDKKVRLLKRNFETSAKNVIEDATAFVLGRLVEEVLNGETGEDYPKAYPSTVSPGSSGFVGVISGNLKRSISFKKLERYEYEITQIFKSLAPYEQYIASWTQREYGINFYEIAIKLYGPLTTRLITQEIVKAVRAADNGRRVNYRNPFPR